MADDVFSLLRKRREAEVLKPATITDELVVNAISRRKETLRFQNLEASRRYRQKHAEEVKKRNAEYRRRPETKARLHEYYLQHKDKSRKRQERYRAKMMATDPEGFLKRNAESSRKSYHKNKEKRLENERIRRQNESPEQREKRLAYGRKYRKEHAEQIREYNRIRDAKRPDRHGKRRKSNDESQLQGVARLAPGTGLPSNEMPVAGAQDSAA